MSKLRFGPLFCLLTSLFSAINAYGQASTQCFSGHSDVEQVKKTFGIKNYDDLVYQIELDQIKSMLDKTVAIHPSLSQKVMATLQCAQKRELEHKNILTLIDFSLPANQKRLWIFDLENKKLLFHTHVSHGIRSGELLSNYFSNINNSKASSIGVYQTGNAYYGRYGLALKLDGLERGFNDQAFGRAIVMHGGWYVSESFVNKYGRPGRSWGCPAIPSELTKAIINTIKDKGLFIAYYPSEKWFLSSNYLNCKNVCQKPKNSQLITKLSKPPVNRETILFVEKDNDNVRDLDEPIIAMAADGYQRTFNTRAPLNRMLRRQIDNQEFIALNDKELNRILDKHPELIHQEKLNQKPEVFFIIQEVKRKRGYWATEMKKLQLGKIERIQAKDDGQLNFTVYFKDRSPVQLKSTNQFIRWLGL